MLLFPLPITLIYLHWGNRPAGMTVLISMLLVSVLMGPLRSLHNLQDDRAIFLGHPQNDSA